jgi:hypothetical protein
MKVSDEITEQSGRTLADCAENFHVWFVRKLFSIAYRAFWVLAGNWSIGMMPIKFISRPYIKI